MMSASPALVSQAIAFFPFFGKRERDPNELVGNSILNAWSFFTKRYEFMWGNFHKTAGNIFKFRVFQYTVVAIRGEEG
ncbi:hypothetical protein BDQ17DRAFT_1364656 [Cyathus striatus]|nr:hypothetical protein BDQ17DRAFT_1364656 [Cyathus striatus]